MNATQALAKARKLLGPKAAIRVNSKCPVGEEREAEIAKRRELSEQLKALKEARDARMNAVLKADAEYQRLKAEFAATEKARDNCHDYHHRRVEILSTMSWYTRHEAAGDNFEEAIADLEAKKGRTT